MDVQTVEPRLSGHRLSGIFNYPDSRLSGLFTLVPPSPDNRGLTVSYPAPNCE